MKLFLLISLSFSLCCVTTHRRLNPYDSLNLSDVHYLRYRLGLSDEVCLQIYRFIENSGSLAQVYLVKEMRGCKDEKPLFLTCEKDYFKLTVFKDDEKGRIIMQACRVILAGIFHL